MKREENLKMKETVKWLWKEANKKRNREETSISWCVGKGTAGIVYAYASKGKVTCYMYSLKNGNYSRPTFILITEKYPYGSDEVGYRKALQLLNSTTTT